MKDLENKEVAVVDDIYDDKKLEATLLEIETKAKALVPDMTTPEGRDAIKSAAYQVARQKTWLDNIGKELVSGWKAKAAVIDEKRKMVRERLDTLKEVVRKPLTDWENREETRVAERKARLEELSRMADFAHTPTSQEVDNRVLRANELYQFDWEEFQAAAENRYEDIKANLNRLLTERKTYESEQAELKELREKAAAQAKKDHEEKIANEAAEKARKEAEEKAEIERKRVEEAAKLAAQKAEDERLAAEAKAKKAEEDRLAAEKAEKERVAAEAEAKRKAEEMARIEAENRAAKAEDDARIEREKADREKEEAAAKAAKEKKEADDRAQKAEDEKKALQEAHKRSIAARAGVIKEWADAWRLPTDDSMIEDLINRMANYNQQLKKAA